MIGISWSAHLRLLLVHDFSRETPAERWLSPAISSSSGHVGPARCQ